MTEEQTRFFGLKRECGLHEDGENDGSGVITSYSIHYTKLYESCSRIGGGDRLGSSHWERKGYGQVSMGRAVSVG